MECDIVTFLISFTDLDDQDISGQQLQLEI
jgi:hypothetical protein